MAPAFPQSSMGAVEAMTVRTSSRAYSPRRGARSHGRLRRRAHRMLHPSCGWREQLRRIRLTGGVASAAYLIAGSPLVVAGGWHRPLGDFLLAGILGSTGVALGAFRGH